MLYIQVLSKSVADALDYFGDPPTEETKKLIRYFDKLFDCLNVRSLSDKLEAGQKTLYLSQ